MQGADVLGIDPGIGATGWGLVRLAGAHSDAPFLLDCGVLKTSPKKKTPERLREIYDTVLGLIQKHSPRALAVEKAFYGKNVLVALTIGQARGAAILAAANLGLPVYEFSAREVKQAVTGNGAADKSQVQYMIGQLLNLKNPPDSPDACDALAVALTYHFRSKVPVGAGSEDRPSGRTAKPALDGVAPQPQNFSRVAPQPPLGRKTVGANLVFAQSPLHPVERGQRGEVADRPRSRKTKPALVKNG